MGRRRELLVYSGDAERGLQLSNRAKDTNPRHPGWYWYPNFYDAYSRRDYTAALALALKVKVTGHYACHMFLAATYAQLGNNAEAAKSLQDLLRARPDFLSIVHSFEKWWTPEYADHLLGGLRKAGLDIAPAETAAAAAPDAARSSAKVPSGATEMA